MTDKNALLNALVDEWGLLPLKSDEIITGDVANIMSEVGKDIDTSTISRKLRNLENQGILESRWALAPGGAARCKAYKPAEGKTYEDVLQYIKGD